MGSVDQAIATSTTSSVLGIMLIVWAIFGIAVYFLPSIIALAKKNRRTKVILFNIFLGWTVVMWIISLVWACKRPVPSAVAQPVPEVQTQPSAEPAETEITQ